MYTNYIRISSGNNPYTTLDPGTASPRNTVGAIYSGPPAPTSVATGGSATKGYSAQPVLKYVLYLSTGNPAPTAFPAPVYYTDESFSTVSAVATEALVSIAGIAGYLLPNTTSISGLTAAQLNNSFCFIQIGGLLVGAAAPTILTGAGVGSYITGAAAGNWTSTVNTTVAASSRVLGVQWTAIAASACDVLVGGYTSFWGS